MTLTEHACRIYAKRVQEAGESWKVPMEAMDLAYGELRAELDAERAQNKLLVEKIAKLPMGCSHCAGFGMLYSHGPYSVSISTCPHCKGSGKAVVTPPAAPADPDLDRIKQERNVAHAALNQIHTAFGDPRCGPFNPTAIAERAVKVIKEWRDKQPEPPKKAVYEWRTITPISDYLFRNQDYVGSVCLYGGGPRRSWDAAGSPSWVRGSSASSDLAKAAVEAVVRAHYGDEA